MSKAVSGFAISEAIHGSWNLFKEKWHLVYGLYLIPVLVAVVYSLIVKALGEDFGLMALFVGFLYMVAQMVVSMGVVQGYINLTRGKEITVETFTDMFPQVINYVIGTIMMMLIVLGGTLLFILPGIYFSLKYYFVPFLIIDKKMGPKEALAASAKMTDGVKWELVGLFGATIALAYLGLFGLIVGVFVTAPVAGLSYVMFYNRLVKRLE